jgi:lysophospholipase L1-like esterase
MIRRIVIGGVALASVMVVGFWLWLQHMATATHDPAFFEDEIVAFESADRDSPPEPGEIVFVGSSSIRMWSSLAEDMAPLRVTNRGFGGAQLEHVIHNVDRIVTSRRPGVVLVYAGDNDLAEGTGKTPEVVLHDWQTLVGRLRAKLPDARIYFLFIKPSPRRWARWPEMQRANALIAGWNTGQEGVGSIDVASPLLGADGAPVGDFYRIDDLHLSDAGYAAWTAAVRPRLLEEMP